MNCPACHGYIGNDLYHVTPWMHELDEHNQIVGATRTIHVYCESCGVFECRQDHEQRIREIHHITNSKDRRRILRKIPGARFAEVAA